LCGRSNIVFLLQRADSFLLAAIADKGRFTKAETYRFPESWTGFKASSRILPQNFSVGGECPVLTFVKVGADSV
jgi:hypothetical protein